VAKEQQRIVEPKIEMKCSILHKVDGLRLAICACNPWKTALNVGLDNMQHWKGLREGEGEINITRDYITSDKTSR
jgi:hypothetical protein